MYGIDLLVKEHENIMVVVNHLNDLCCDILEGKPFKTDDFRQCIDAARNYADHHHHGKEEKILFQIMLDNLGPVAEKLIRGGMFVEHDLGRFHVSELAAALDEYDKDPSTRTTLGIVTHATGYANLLARHIEKEDAVVYSFAERSLSDELKAQVNEETREFEREAEEAGIQEKYLKIIDQWR